VGVVTWGYAAGGYDMIVLGKAGKAGKWGGIIKIRKL